MNNKIIGLILVVIAGVLFLYGMSAGMTAVLVVISILISAIAVIMFAK